MRIATQYYSMSIHVSDNINMIVGFYTQLGGIARINGCGMLIKEIKRKV